MVDAQQFLGLVQQTLKDPKAQFNNTLYSTFYGRLFSHPESFTLLQKLLTQKRYTFVRHAQSVYNIWSAVPGNIGPQYPCNPALYDPSISQFGFQQCVEFPSPGLKFDVAYVSPAKRTLQTYENIPVQSKRVVVTPFVRQRSDARACVIGMEPGLLKLNFPGVELAHFDRQRYWWRHDYVNAYEEGLETEDSPSVEARIGFFFLLTLLDSAQDVLVVSHGVFLELIDEMPAPQLPENAKPYPIRTDQLMRMYSRIKSRVISPKL